MLRSYDPQTGRFLQNDPYDQFASGYVGMGNDPGNLIEEDGGCAGCSFAQSIQAAINAPTLEGVTIIASLSKVNGKSNFLRTLLNINTTFNGLDKIGEQLNGHLWHLNGAVTAILDNASGGWLNFRNTGAPDPALDPTAAEARDLGLHNGDIASLAMAVIEGDIGGGLTAGGAFVTVASGGVLGEVSVLATVVGGGMMVHSTIFFGREAYNLSNGSGQVKVEGQSSNPEMPKYENPGQHDPNGGENPYDPNKSVLPDNHEELWKRSIPDPKEGDTRWTKEGDKNPTYHRFQDDGNGNWHWNGSTKGKTKNNKDRKISINDVPVGIKRN